MASTGATLDLSPLERARNLVRSGHQKEALEAVEALIKDQPLNDDALTLRAMLRSDVGHDLQAWTDMQQVVSLREQRGDPRRHAARINRAMLSLKLGDTEAAIRDLEESEAALRGTPAHGAAAGNLAHALWRAGDYTTSAEVARRGLEEIKEQLLASPESPAVQLQALSIKLNLADALCGMGQHDDAAQCWNWVISQTSNHLWPALHARAHQAQAKLALERQDLTAARAHLTRARRAARIASNAVLQLETLITLARLELAGGAPAQAVSAAERSLALCESTEGLSAWTHRQHAHALISEAHHRQGQPEEALQALKRSIEAERVAWELQSSQHLKVLQVRHELDRTQEQVRVATEAHRQAKTEVAQKVSELIHLATHDHLTDLPNRKMFEECVSLHITQWSASGRESAQQGGRVAIGLVDLDRFKLINDSMGHAAGDQLLRGMAERIRQSLKPNEMVARMGGDEFLLLLPASADEALEERIRELVQAFREPVMVGGEPIAMAASMGISIWPDEADTPDELLRLADQAMYHAKRTGHTHARYDPAREMPTNVLQLERALTQAAINNDFELIYQPIIDLRGRSISSAEALLRWTGPEGVPVSPVVFIPILEQTGLIERVGRWTILQAWQELEHTGLVASVNVSPRQLHVQRLEDVIDEGVALGLDPRRLQLEITESSLVVDPARGAELLRKLSDRGVTVAIDDFGTGHSNLGLLRKLPAHVLKIDRSFSQELGLGGAGDGIIEAMHRLAGVMGMKTVLEGVEEHHQEAAAQALGIQMAQGWLYHKGAGAARLDAMLADLRRSLAAAPERTTAKAGSGAGTSDPGDLSSLTDTHVRSA